MILCIEVSARNGANTFAVIQRQRQESIKGLHGCSCEVPVGLFFTMQTMQCSLRPVTLQVRSVTKRLYPISMPRIHKLNLSPPIKRVHAHGKLSAFSTSVWDVMGLETLALCSS